MMAIYATIVTENGKHNITTILNATHTWQYINLMSSCQFQINDL